MSTPAVLRTLYTFFVALALAVAPCVAFGKHHGGIPRGAGGSHHGGSRSGGGFHGGNRGRGGFHLDGGGHSSGKNFRSGRSASPRQMGSGSDSRFRGSANRANISSGYFGSRSVGPNGPRKTNGTFVRSLGTSDARAIATPTYALPRNFGSNRPPSTAPPSQSWSAERQSPWAGTSGSTTFNSNRPPNAASSSRSWSGQGQFSMASPPRSPSSFNANRPPSAASAPRSWPGQGQSSLSSAPRSTSSFNSNRPPNAAAASRSWSGKEQIPSANALKSTSFFDRNRGTSNFGNSRFGNSASKRSSFFHSRTGSNVPRFGSSKFGGAHQFDWGAASFNRENTFGGSELWFVPDLFGLALDFGAGLDGFGVGGLNLLDSGLGDFNFHPGQDSRQWGPSLILYPTGNCASTQ
jgi:hypothetical protein